LSQLAQRQPQFAARGARIVAVTLGKPSEAMLFGAQYSDQIICLSDPEQASYRAYHVGRLNPLAEMFSPGNWLGYMRAWRHGHRAGATDQDYFRLNATFVIRHGGIVELAHYNRYSGHFPDWDGLVRAVPVAAPA
jgi:hypothetical protein